MKRMMLQNVLGLVLLASLVLGTALVAEAQRGRVMGPGMMGQQQDQPYDEDGRGHGPGMMGQGMMGPGMMGQGMMGQGMMGPCMMEPGMGMMGFLNLPDLTSEQQNELRTMQREARREHMNAMLDIMDIRDDMMEAMAAERPDPKKVRAHQESMNKKQADLVESAIKKRNRMYDVLTEDQQTRLREQRAR